MPSTHPRELLREQWRRVQIARTDVLHARQNSERLLAAVQRLATETAELRTELHAARAEVGGLAARFDELAGQAATHHRTTLDALRAVRDDDARARETLWRLRETPAYAAAFDDDEPLVTVIITTYRNLEPLRERSLPSVLAQTYERLEVIVIGDAAPDETHDIVASFGDGRARFVNLPYRGPYPDDPAKAWLVSGTTPYNTGLALATGQWIASNSDDDALRPDHVDVLLDLARRERAEVPYGQLAQVRPDGAPADVLGCFPPQYAQWGMQAALMHAALRFLPLQPSDWIFGVPNDWSLGERMLRIGVRFAYTEKPVVDYYPSHLWTDRLTRDLF